MQADSGPKDNQKTPNIITILCRCGGEVYMSYQQLCPLFMSDCCVFTSWLYTGNTYIVFHFDKLVHDLGAFGLFHYFQ